MRRATTLSATLLGALGLMFLAGCGSNIKEGTPDNIDMTQDFSPMAKPIGINPADSAKAEAISAKNAAENAGGAAPGGMPGVPGSN